MADRYDDKAREAPAPASSVEVADLDRETLGRLVRDVWIAWAREQPTPKPSWLVPWEGLSEPDREVDRRIGEAVARAAVTRLAAENERLTRELENARYFEKAAQDNEESAYKEKSDSDAENDRLAADNARLTEEYDRLGRMHHQLAELNVTRQREIRDLRARLDAAERARDILAADNARLTREIEERRTEGLNMSAEIDALRGGATALRARFDAAERERDAALRDLATARAAAFEEAARAIDNWPHVAAIVRAIAAKGGA